MQSVKSEMNYFETAANPQALKALAGAKILLVDDDAINQAIVTLFLEELNVHVSVADNGQEAIEKTNAERFDLVFMDVQMPVLDGLEATAKLRENPLWQNLPIIAMTAYSRHEDYEKILAAGMNDYLNKPIEETEIQQILLQWLLKKNTASNKSQVSVDDNSVKSVLSNLSSIDVDKALIYLGNKPDFLLSILLQFKKDSPQTITQLKQWFADKNWTEIQFKAHALKSVCACFCADQLHKMASELEQSLITSNIAIAEKLTISVILKLEQMLDELEKLAPIQQEVYPQITNTPATVNSKEIVRLLEQLIQYLKAGELYAQESVKQLQSLLLHHPRYVASIKQLSADVDNIDYPAAIESATQLLSLFSEEYFK
jgi:CheY-like chemotaxis protein/HPt (histidine-containing phosphotransfer) domain-containing protein